MKFGGQIHERSRVVRCTTILKRMKFPGLNGYALSKEHVSLSDSKYWQTCEDVLHFDRKIHPLRMSGRLEGFSETLKNPITDVCFRRVVDTGPFPAFNEEFILGYSAITRCC